MTTPAPPRFPYPHRPLSQIIERCRLCGQSRTWPCAHSVCPKREAA